MTSPPLSETGPSPEAAQIVAEWLKAPWVRDPVPPGRDPREGAVGMLAMTKEHKRDLIQRIDAALLAAKRSAHLQDARAGCEDCRNEVPMENWNDESARKSWWHDHGMGMSRQCERPEVWDALSPLPPKGTK